MHQMLTLHELRQRMGQAARARMERHHRLDEALQRLAERMRLLARPAAAAPSALTVAREPRMAGGTVGGRKTR